MDCKDDSKIVTPIGRGVRRLAWRCHSTASCATNTMSIIGFLFSSLYNSGCMKTPDPYAKANTLGGKERATSEKKA